MMLVVKEKPVVVITGVSSGIGYATAQLLTDNDYFVFGSVRSDTTARRVESELGDSFRALVFDVTDRKAIGTERDLAAAALGDRGICALVNNAGLGLFGPLELLDDADFEKIVTVNLFGARNVTNAFLPLLRKGRDKFTGTDGSQHVNKTGKIINISSLSGILNTPMNGAYCVSKHALESLGEIYRRELLPFGIDVVSIRSGPIQSEIWNKNITADTPFQDTPYAQMAGRVQSIMRRAQRNALSASVIAKLVQGIIENRKRRTAYELGEGTITSIVLSRLLPKRYADRLINGTLQKRPNTKRST